MASKRDLQSYYAKSDNAKAKWSNQNDKLIASDLIKSTPNITGKIEILLVQQEVKKQVVNSHYENIQLNMRQEIGNYSTIHGNKAAIDRCSKICVKFFLKRTTVNTWKEQFKIKDFLLFARKKRTTKFCGWWSLVKIRDFLIASRLAGTVISQKMRTAIGTGVIKAIE